LNCATTNVTRHSDKWSKHELRPSQITYDGSVFFSDNLVDGTRFGVFYDSTVNEDAGVYYHRLIKDFGWYSDGDGKLTGSVYTTIRYEMGYIYVNPKRRVAVYFNPTSDKYSAYKVKLEE
jgi:hypothetical protein